MSGPTPTRSPSAPPVLSRRLEFRSFDDFIDAVQDASIGGSILRKEDRPWRLESHFFGTALVQTGQAGAPSVSEFQVAPDRTGFVILAPEAPPRFVEGREMGADALNLLRPGALVQLSTPIPTSWLSVTASPGAVEREAALLAGAPFRSAPVPTTPLIWNPTEAARLRTLLREVIGALDSAPEPLHPEAVANLEGTLLRTLAGTTLDSSSGRERGRPPRVERSSAFRSIFEFLRTLPPGPVYVEDLCRATGLPERTLRLLFLEQFGESPVRVLRARRLCLAYEALQEHVVGLKEIRQVAGRYGFWHMGQFAADYRALFGERPSDTVRRARLRGPRSRPLRAVADVAGLPPVLAAAR